MVKSFFKILAKAFTKKVMAIFVTFVVANVLIVVIEKEQLQLSKDIINDAENYKNYLFALLIVSAAAPVMSYIRRMTSELSRELLTDRINDMYVKKLIGSDYMMFERFGPSDLFTSFNETHTLYGLLLGIIQIITDIINIFVTFVIMLKSVTGNMIFLLIVSIFIFGTIYSRLLKRFINQKSETRKSRKNRNRVVDELINGALDIKTSSSSVIDYTEKINAASKAYIDNVKKTALYQSSIPMIIESYSSVIGVSLVAYAIISVLAGNVDAANGLFVVMLGWELLRPVCSIVDTIADIGDNSVTIKDFLKVMEFQSKITDGEIELESFNSSITFKNVSYSYDKSTNVLSDVNLTIRKCEKVGICGASGGGKSTLLKLIPRIYDVTGGEILIDGLNIKTLKKESYLNRIGFVHQAIYIFDDTLKNNILFGVNRNVTEYEIIEACKKANLYDFVLSLKNGFETKVGPRGMKLSGGQRQRISLARVFLQNPEIIILDEATSALDNQSETVIQDAIEKLHGKTVICVAHRLSTIKDFDKIVVIDNHTVAEEGSHRELISKGGVYASLWK